MAVKLNRLTHKIAIQLHLVAESCIICSSRSRRPVRRLLDTPSYWKTKVKGEGKGKGKVVVPLLIEHHAMKAYWGSGGIAQLIL
jgi:hypothetical protein